LSPIKSCVGYTLNAFVCNGLEKTLERKDPARGRRWQLAEETAVYGINDESFTLGWPITTEHVS
jgi:hypothetical protein